MYESSPREYEGNDRVNDRSVARRLGVSRTTLLTVCVAIVAALIFVADFFIPPFKPVAQPGVPATAPSTAPAEARGSGNSRLAPGPTSRRDAGPGRPGERATHVASIVAGSTAGTPLASSRPATAQVNAGEANGARLNGSAGSESDDESPIESPPPARPARILDALAIAHKPNSYALGLEPVYMLYEGNFWPPQSASEAMPSESLVRGLAQQAALARAIVCIDIERWPTDIRVAKPIAVEESIQRLAQIADWMHAERPDLRLGFYGTCPTCDYFTPVNFRIVQKKLGARGATATPPSADAAARDPGMKAWRASNEFVRQRLSRHIDVVFPSLYTFFNDPPNWEIYARENIAEANRYGKAVYPFIWYRYHPSEVVMHNGYIPADFWAKQLEITTTLSEGPVIWGGMGESWNAQIPWWRATLEFLDEHPEISARNPRSGGKPRSRRARPGE